MRLNGLIRTIELRSSLSSECRSWKIFFPYPPIPASSWLRLSDTVRLQGWAVVCALAQTRMAREPLDGRILMTGNLSCAWVSIAVGTMEALSRTQYTTSSVVNYIYNRCVLWSCWLSTQMSSAQGCGRVGRKLTVSKLAGAACRRVGSGTRGGELRCDLWLAVSALRRTLVPCVSPCSYLDIGFNNMSKQYWLSIKLPHIALNSDQLLPLCVCFLSYRFAFFNINCGMY